MIDGVLSTLLQAIGPSGREGPAAQAWRKEAAKFSKVRVDRSGNSYADVRPGPRGHRENSILLTAHIDEIGFVVQSISEEGMLQIAGVGDWDPRVLLAQRVVLLHEGRRVCGVVGCKPTHLIEEKEQKAGLKLSNLWVDIGTSSREEAARLVSVGDTGTVDAQPLLLAGGQRVASKSLDDRAGCYIILETLRNLAIPDVKPWVTALATTREELGWYGAAQASGWGEEDIIIAVDGTFATDVGEADTDQLGEHPLGSGPVIFRSALGHKGIEDLLIEVAQSLEIPYTVQACGEETSTDLDMFVTGYGRLGAAAALVSFPIRHMHSPCEVVDMRDIESTILLLTAFCDAAATGLDLTAGL